MGFWVGSWLHDIPDSKFDANGKRVIIRHLCFGPVETHLWYELANGQYCREIHFIEGIQEGERYVDLISQAEMLAIIENEIILCQEHNQTGLAALLQAAKARLNIT